MGDASRGHADDAQAGGGIAAALDARPARHVGGGGNLSTAVAPLVVLCCGDAKAVWCPAGVSWYRGREDAVYHRRRRFGRGWQIDHRPRLASLAGALAQCAQGRSSHHRRVSVSERGARARRADGQKRISRKLRSSRFAALSLGHQSRAAAGARAALFASRLRRCPQCMIEIDWPGLLIVEGLNVLQTGRLPQDGKVVPFVSDFFDFSVYIDADEDVLLSWYVTRFLTLRGTAFADPKSYFHRYARLTDSEAIETATDIWNRINLVNLHENIVPTRPRADLILKKSESHRVEEVALRRL